MRSRPFLTDTSLHAIKELCEARIPAWVFWGTSAALASGILLVAVLNGRTAQSCEQEDRVNELLRAAYAPRVVSRHGTTSISNNTGDYYELPTQNYNRIILQMREDERDAMGLAKERGITKFRMPALPGP